MEKETYKIMEYDRIREMLADRASSRIGAGKDARAEQRLR